eukprot:gene25588-30900_t
MTTQKINRKPKAETVSRIAAKPVFDCGKCDKKDVIRHRVVKRVKKAVFDPSVNVSYEDLCICVWCHTCCLQTEPFKEQYEQQLEDVELNRRRQAERVMHATCLVSAEE